MVDALETVDSTLKCFYGRKNQIMGLELNFARVMFIRVVAGGAAYRDS